MKFWHKTLLMVLALFIAALDVSVIMVMNKSWQLNMERETQRASSEQALIANNVYENLNSLLARGSRVDRPVLYEVMRSYAQNYRQQGIALQLWDRDELVYPAGEGQRQKPAVQAGQVEEQGVHIIRIAGGLSAPYEQLLFVYEREIGELYARQSELNHFFVLINFTVGPILAILLYILIRKLTSPLRLLSETTKRIAEGNYTERIQLSNRDEFGELAQNFNRMSEAVQGHVTELSEMAEEKQRLVDNLAHELRTPLTSMQGFAEYLNTANIGEEDRVTASRYIWSETLRLKKLAFKLLDLSAMRHKRLELERVDIRELFQSVQQTEMKPLQDAGLRLVLDPAIDSVWGDADLLAAFLVNCIDNSIHASAAGGEIRLLAYKENAEAVLEVRDFGSGMTDEQAKRAFEPFYRADSARSRAHGGAGLGLSLCRQIAEAHGARLTLESAKHEGTRCRIFLQLHNNSVAGS
ncbi:sensor histidine kinase [Paenibacillus sp. HW567]|uniref:sensor histidine kinase n=1 Tax=Paenibacillus sp. HW567 TaxID=1034769 RepID=UPI00036C843D|nr:HAMP domain-containing sensor histidine kinase [Paenibacillus sp. HW567]